MWRVIDYQLGFQLQDFQIQGLVLQTHHSLILGPVWLFCKRAQHIP